MRPELVAPASVVRLARAAATVVLVRHVGSAATVVLVRHVGAAATVVLVGSVARNLAGRRRIWVVDVERAASGKGRHREAGRDHGTGNEAAIAHIPSVEMQIA